MAYPFKWDDRGRLLASALDCSSGKALQLYVLKRFDSSVHHVSSSPLGPFCSRCSIVLPFAFLLNLLVLLYTRFSVILRWFHVVEESDHHFRFSVASKKVGFMVLDLKHIISENFDVYFQSWCREEDDQWIVVKCRKSNPLKLASFAKNLVQKSPIKKHHPSDHLRRLVSIRL